MGLGRSGNSWSASGEGGRSGALGSQVTNGPP